MIVILRVFSVIACLVLITLLLMPFQWFLNKTQHKLRNYLPVFWHRCAARLIGLKVHMRGKLSASTPLLLVSNHVSWLDIIVLGACGPLHFIAKKEVAHWPLFGKLARLQRTIFVDRKRRQATVEQVDTLADRLLTGDRIVLFAEGTSTSGVHVKPFRSALLGAAERVAQQTSTLQVQPLALAYTHLNGMPALYHERPLTGFYGNMTLILSLWTILKEGAIDAVVNFGEPITISSHSDRKHLARALNKYVRRLRRLCFVEN